MIREDDGWRPLARREVYGGPLMKAEPERFLRAWMARRGPWRMKDPSGAPLGEISLVELEGTNSSCASAQIRLRGGDLFPSYNAYFEFQRPPRSGSNTMPLVGSVPYQILVTDGGSFSSEDVHYDTGGIPPKTKLVIEDSGAAAVNGLIAARYEEDSTAHESWRPSFGRLCEAALARSDELAAAIESVLNTNGSGVNVQEPRKGVPFRVQPQAITAGIAAYPFQTTGRVEVIEITINGPNGRVSCWNDPERGLRVAVDDDRMPLRDPARPIKVALNPNPVEGYRKVIAEAGDGTITISGPKGRVAIRTDPGEGLKVTIEAS